MNTLSVTASLLTYSLAWALLYSLWQGLLVYGTLYVLLKAMPNINARAKYYLSFSAFSGLFLWFADTWLIQYQKLKGITVYITQPDVDAATGTTTYAIRATGTAHIQNPMLHHIAPAIEKYFPLMIAIYTIGLSFMLLRFLVNLLQVGALQKQGITEASQEWNDFVLQWQQQFDITRPVRLFLSTRVSVPMMLGVLKPVILLPIATINYLTTEQLEAILLHELAHIKRHDYLLNIFQTIAETILFFNPFVWLISRIIRKEREHCCDDLVVSCSASPLPYAKALAILEDSRLSKNKLALAATGNKNQLFHRIKRIMEMKKSNINYSKLTIIIVAIIAITFSIAMFTFTPSFAQKAKGSGSDTTNPKKKTVYKYKTVTVDKNGKKTETVKESATPMKGKIKKDDDDEEVIVIDDNDGKKSNNNSYSYSYSYSDKDGDDLGKAIKEITIAATKTAMDAVANIDFKEITKELEEAQDEMNSVDWDKIKREMDKGIAEVDKQLKDPKLRKEINEEVRKELEDAKHELEDAKREIKKSRHEIALARPVPPAPPVPPMGSMAPMPPMPSTSPDLPEPPAPPAPVSDNNIESMLNKMEKDGLIDRAETYKVRTEDGDLYINGEKQPEAVYQKYSHYIKDKSVNIKGHKGSLSITVND